MIQIDVNASLEEMARQIEVQANESDQHMIAAAMLVREARRRVEAGEAGDVTWHEWAPQNIKLSLSRLRDLQAIAATDDPAKELDRQRKLTRKRVEKHRKRKRAQAWKQDRERRDLIAWAKEAPIEQVRRLLKQAGRLPSAASSPLSEISKDVEHRQAA